MRDAGKVEPRGYVFVAGPGRHHDSHQQHRPDMRDIIGAGGSGSIPSGVHWSEADSMGVSGGGGGTGTGGDGGGRGAFVYTRIDRGNSRSYHTDGSTSAHQTTTHRRADPLTSGGGQWDQWGWRQKATISILSLLSGLTYGYNTGVVSPALVELTDNHGWSSQSLAAALFSSAPSIGAFFACLLIAAPLTYHFGRRKVLVLGGLMSAVGAGVSAAVTPDLDFLGLLLVWRILLGGGIGILSVVCPLHVAEVSPPEKRGRYLSWFQFSVTLGITFGYLFGFSVRLLIRDWRMMLGAGAIPAVALVLFVSIFLPESFVWLEEQENMQGGMGDDSSYYSSQKMSTLRIYKEKFKPSHLVSPKRQHWPKLLFGVTLGMALQLTGINAILYFATDILKEPLTSMGADHEYASHIAVTLLGGFNSLCSLLFIYTADCIGRRPVYLIGILIMIISDCMLGISILLPSEYDWKGHVTAISCVTFIFGFAGFGIVYWIIINEIFVIEAKDYGVAYSTASNWFFNIAVSITFLITDSGGIFLAYACVGLFALVFGYLWMPENKQKTLDEIKFMTSQYTPIML
eukprot:TRINITY_DN5561_c0_g1_i1.p1 TRINITY_DN5561_c0_g1~~TRINITY_DN5561_c0_g1_i1.p1  ORF type:complete len:581 (+),score=65.02 TRINITY_DN5561_c0_g1_i1:29-1744(+)